MIKAADIIDLIYQTADHNVSLNKHLLDSIPDAVEGSTSYINQWATCIARDVGLVEDKDDLYERLFHEVILNAFRMKVLTAYLDETDRQLDLDIEDQLNFTN